MAHYQTNFNDFTLGSIVGQQGWFNPNPVLYLDPTIEEAVVFSGREAHAAASAVKNAMCARLFDGFGAGGVQWFKGSFASRQDLPYLVTLIADAGLSFLSNLFLFGALFNVDKIVVQNGAVLNSTGVTFTSDEPHTVKAKINFTSKKWDAYVDDMVTPILTNLDLENAGINDIRGFGFMSVATMGTKVMGDIFVGDFDPDAAIFRRRREV